MLFLLRIYRMTALFIWFAITGMMAFPFAIVGTWKCIGTLSKLAKVWGGGIAKIMNFNIRIHGDVSTFKGGLIVSNHSGYVDIITHSAVFPIRFTPKVEISRWPLLGWFLALSRPIWIDRSSKQKSQRTIRKIKETIDHGIPLLVYPEGTSTDNLHGLLPFKSPPFEPVVEDNLPVLPVITVFEQQENRPLICWYGKKVLLPHVWSLLAHPSVIADLHILPPAYPEGRDRKEFAKYLHEMMEAKYWEIRGMEPPATESEVENVCPA